MNYFVIREGQQYGPYTLADLQRYLASGNIAPTDLAKSEGMEQAVPVQQIVGNISVSQTPPLATPSYGQVPGFIPPPGSPAGPLPSGLHWALVLLFAILTCGVFSWVWMFIEANFAKKIKPDSSALLYYAIGLPGIIAGSILANALPVDSRWLGGLMELGFVVVLVMGHFSLKNSLEEYYTSTENINLQLSGVMTFFFNVFYFQYHLSRIRTWKLTGVLT